MYFRREGIDPSNDDAWQQVDSGSPGERTAAMLSLVLSHGTEPLVLDQPEDDLDTEWISQLVVRELRRVRWNRQVIVVTHNANIPVVGDADRVIVMENRERALRVREDGPVEVAPVRQAVQNILEGGVEAFVAREKRYNNELDSFRVARGIMEQRDR
jgi:ABC-type cobalamin/Fe3+-siderophores transport system ATPase subunit